MPLTNISLYLESGGYLNINDGNIDNHTNEVVKSDSIIASIPVNRKYNNMIVYNNEDGCNSFVYRANYKKQFGSKLKFSKINSKIFQGLRVEG